jgi:pumilio homology domain family member 6
VVDPEFKFASKLYHAIRPHISQWATGDGSFVVVALLEALLGEEKEGLRKDLKSHEKAIKEKAGSNKGSKLILEKIA